MLFRKMDMNIQTKMFKAVGLGLGTEMRTERPGKLVYSPKARLKTYAEHMPGITALRWEAAGL
jgi:hypothetical protein